MKRKSEEACPCGRSQPYAQCCGLLHAGAAAPDAESLMRSRYCAYVLDLETYLLESWHASTRPAAVDLAQKARPKWIGLEVRRHEPSGDTAIVEFVARFRVGGRAQRLHEISRFRREEGRWYYVDGDYTPPAGPG